MFRLTHVAPSSNSNTDPLCQPENSRIPESHVLLIGSGPLPILVSPPAHSTPTMSGALKRFLPLFDRVLIQRAEAATKSKGGILIPEKAQGKVNEGTVVAVGAGALNETNGQLRPLAVAVGDRVMLPEFGGTKIQLEDKEYTLFREADIIAKIAQE